MNNSVSVTFAALSATGTTTAQGIRVTGGYARTHGIQAVTTGGPTTATLDLEGTIDGTNWFAILSGVDASSSIISAVADKPVKQIRFNLTALAGGTSPTVTPSYLGLA